MHGPEPGSAREAARNVYYASGRKPSAEVPECLAFRGFA